MAAAAPDPLFHQPVFYQTLSAEFHSPADHTLGPLVIAMPVIGGLIVGLIARYGSPQIRSHGIPEAIEAIRR
jgi:H+/Cl- antiporter ClcA